MPALTPTLSPEKRERVGRIRTILEQRPRSLSINCGIQHRVLEDTENQVSRISVSCKTLRSIVSTVSSDEKMRPVNLEH